MTNKISLLMLIVLITMGSCAKEDFTDVRNRISSLEDWKQSVDKDITSLQGLLKAFQENDYVLGVESLTDGSGYQINFHKNKPVIIKNGESGRSPLIGTRQHTDGKYYWTVNGEWLLLGTSKIPVSGEKGENGLSPTIGTNGNWWIGTNDTGVKAQGDAVFAKNGLNTYDNYLELTLADGITKFKFPIYKSFKIGTDETNEVLKLSTSTTIALKLPTDLKPTDCVTMIAQVTSKEGIGTHVRTRTVDTSWKVEVNLPTFTNEVCNDDASVKITPPAGYSTDDQAILEISMISHTGSRIETSRALKYIILYQVGDYYPDPAVTFNPDKTVATGTAPLGIVFRLDNPIDGKSKNGWIVNMYQSSTQVIWGPNVKTSALDDWNGLANTRNVKSVNDNFSDHPIFKYTDEQNTGIQNYGDDSKKVWYLPSFREIQVLYATYNKSSNFLKQGERNEEAQEEFNHKLSVAGGDPFISDYYWTSREFRDNSASALTLHFHDGTGWVGSKNENRSFRSICAF